ncbi:MAG: hypothetical protein KF823_15830 [Xanthomonadales bacterium]|nr:hypothetical protein [Xanthomonadales bacterium]
MVRLLLRGLLGVLVLVLLAQALLWWQVSRWAASTARALQPVAELTWSSSYAWLTGRAGLRNVRLAPHGAPGSTATAAAVELGGGSLTGLLRLFRGDEGLPEDVRLVVRRLRLGPELERMLRSGASRWGHLLPFEATGCRDDGLFTGVDYGELGWLQTEADVEFRMRRGATDGAGRGQVELAWDMHPLVRIEFELEAAGLVSTRMVAPPSTIERLRVRIDDRGMVAQRNAYCARLLGISPADFQARHLAAVRDHFETQGVFPDDAAIGVYAGFAQSGGRLELLATPSSAVPLADYRHYRRADQLRMFNAMLRHDQGAVTQVAASFLDDEAERRDAAALGRPETASEAVRVRVEAGAADELSFDELDDLAGARISVRTRQGIGYVGTLLGTQGPLVRIEIRQPDGRTRVLALSSDSIESIRMAQ